VNTVAKRLRTVLLIPAIVFALASCGGGGEGNDGPDSGSPPTTPTPAPSPGTVDTTAPTVPQGVTATAQTSTQVLVSWSASTDAGTGVAGYRVFRNGDASPLATVQTLSYTDGNVVANTAYSYTIVAFDAASPANVSAPSAAASATTPPTPTQPDTTPPSTPTQLRATALSTSEIGLQWTASTDSETGVAGYRIYRDGSTTPIASVQSTSFTDTGLAAGTRYSYSVLAYDGATPANESALSSSASATTQAQPPPVDVTPPSVPSNVTAAAQSTSSILVSWVASTDASGIAAYRIFRDGGATPVATVQGTTFTDTNLAANTTYSYTVTAVDGAPAANESAPSAPASATTNPEPPPADTTPPSVPTNVSAVPQSASQILVSWTASTDASGIAGYEVLREGVAEPIAVVQTTSYTDDSLSAGTTYTYRVRAIDGATPANRSAESAPATATTDSQPILDFTPPTVPTNVRAEVGGGPGPAGREVRVRWDASTDESGISGYRVFRNGGAAPIATVQNRDYRDRDVQPNTTYTYTVQAVDGAVFPNVSDHSAPASVTTPP
jgi:chitinase